ncbi:unnamed protein product [Ascophyllum nodosum]
MDDYYTSVLLFLCLLKNEIFAMGTARTNRKGIAGALDVFRKIILRLRNKSDMNFARSGEIAACEWKDTKAQHAHLQCTSRKATSAERVR